MNANLIPELPFKFTRGNPENTFTVTNQWFDTSGWVRYDVVRDYDELHHIVSAVTLLTKLKSGEWKIIKEENNMKKINPTDLAGFIAKVHHPYTDYNEEIANWLMENAEVDNQTPLNYGGYIFTDEQGTFYGQKIIYNMDVYYTNEEFKNWIGMTKKATTKDKLASILNVEGQRALDYLKEKYMNKGFTKADLKHGDFVTVSDRVYKVNCTTRHMVAADGGYILFSSLDDDLTFPYNPSLRVTKVERPIVVFERVDEKQLAIQKELEFAKAKAERLAAHISVLESKLK